MDPGSLSMGLVETPLQAAQVVNGCHKNITNILQPSDNLVKTDTVRHDLHCRWLAMDLGLPLEAPMQATRGWDILSLQGGIQSLSERHALVLGLFCR